jgi:hypothetical protein
LTVTAKASVSAAAVAAAFSNLAAGETTHSNADLSVSGQLSQFDTGEVIGNTQVVFTATTHNQNVAD